MSKETNNKEFSEGMKIMFEEYEKELAKRTKREKLFQSLKDLITTYSETDTERIECEVTFLNSKEDEYSEIIYRHKFVKEIPTNKVRGEKMEELKIEKKEQSGQINLDRVSDSTSK